MSQPPIKWCQLERYCSRHGYVITGRGGEKKISAPKNSLIKGSRNQVVIGHQCCSHPGDTVLRCYLRAIERAFGITAQDILND